LNIPLVRGNVVLVGDAAGLCDRLFAEGMSKAMISSRVLAKNILSLQNYEHDLMKVLGRHLWITGVLSKIRDSTPYYMFVKLIKIVSFMHKFIKIKGLNSTTELFPPVNLLHDS
jgi:flavin-dependent dehydrogenase